MRWPETKICTGPASAKKPTYTYNLGPDTIPSFFQSESQPIALRLSDLHGMSKKFDKLEAPFSLKQFWSEK